MQGRKTGTDLSVKEGEMNEAECITLHSDLGGKQRFGLKSGNLGLVPGGKNIQKTHEEIRNNTQKKVPLQERA